MLLVRATREDRLTARNTRSGKLSEADVIDIQSDFAARDLGEGLALIERAQGDRIEGKPAVWLGDSGLALEVDRIGLKLSGDEVKKFAQQLGKIIRTKKLEALNELVEKLLR